MNKIQKKYKLNVEENHENHSSILDFFEYKCFHLDILQVQ